MGNDMSIKHIIARHALVDDVDRDIVKAWNNIHVEYKMQLKWEIKWFQVQMENVHEGV